MTIFSIFFIFLYPASWPSSLLLVPQSVRAAQLVWAGQVSPHDALGPAEVELVLQVARAMRCSRRRLRGGGGRAEHGLRLKLVRCQGHPGPELHGAIIATLGLLLQELTWSRGRLSRSRLSFSVCHARGTSANIIIELIFPVILIIYEARLQLELCE